MLLRSVAPCPPQNQIPRTQAFKTHHTQDRSTNSPVFFQNSIEKSKDIQINVRMIATITSKGQITLPARIRKALNVKSGDKLDFHLDQNGELRAKKVDSSLDSLVNILPRTSKRLSVEEMDEVIRNKRTRT